MSPIEWDGHELVTSKETLQPEERRSGPPLERGTSQPQTGVAARKQIKILLTALVPSLLGKQFTAIECNSHKRRHWQRLQQQRARAMMIASTTGACSETRRMSQRCRQCVSPEEEERLHLWCWMNKTNNLRPETYFSVKHVAVGEGGVRRRSTAARLDCQLHDLIEKICVPIQVLFVNLDVRSEKACCI